MTVKARTEGAYVIRDAMSRPSRPTAKHDPSRLPSVPTAEDKVLVRALLAYHARKGEA